MKTLTLLLILGTMLSCKKNQVLPFQDDFNCIPCESSYCVPIEQGDTNTIEVSLTEITDNLITNGNFASSSGWTIGTDWAIASGKATANFTTGGVLSRPIDSTITAGYYLVQFDVISAAVSFGLKVRIGGALIPGPLVGTIAGTHLGTTTYKFYKYIDTADITDNLLSFEVISGDEFSIDNVVLYKISSIQYEIKNCDTDEVFYTNDNNEGIVYFETGLLTPTAGDDDGNSADVAYATVTLNWTEIGLDDGCYCICFKDAGLIGYEFIENGTFDSSDNWIINNTGSGWTITAGVARHTGFAPAGDDDLDQTLVVPLSPTQEYELTFDTISAGSWSVRVLLTSATFAISQDFAGTGNASNSHVFSGISGEQIIGITFRSVGGGNTFDIDNVSIKAHDVACETSNCISLRESWDTFATTRKMCNILVTGTNANKAFGFSAGYSFKGRIFGVIRNASYPDIDNTEYKDFTGLKSLQYNDNEKISELSVYEVPEGVHDWLRLALRSQTLTLEIAGQSRNFIKKAGDYTPNNRKSSPNSPVIVEIQEVQQVPATARNV